MKGFLFQSAMVMTMRIWHLEKTILWGLFLLVLWVISTEQGPPQADQHGTYTPSALTHRYHRLTNPFTGNSTLTKSGLNLQLITVPTRNTTRLYYERKHYISYVSHKNLSIWLLAPKQVTWVRRSISLRIIRNDALNN